jgi:hypothetical protein
VSRFHSFMRAFLDIGNLEEVLLQGTMISRCMRIGMQTSMTGGIGPPENRFVVLPILYMQLKPRFRISFPSERCSKGKGPLMRALCTFKTKSISSRSRKKEGNGAFTAHPFVPPFRSLFKYR